MLAQGTSSHTLPSVWRLRATELRNFAACEQAATAYEYAARELESVIARDHARSLSIQEAADRVGRHPDTIRKAIAEGKLTNVGRKNKPGVQLGELLARYPGTNVAPNEASSYTAGADALFDLVGGRGAAR